PRAEVLADLHTGDGAGAVGHLAADEATHLAAVGQHGDRTAVETRRRRLQDDGVAGPPPARHLDDVAATQRGERLRDRVALRARAAPRQLGLEVADLAAQVHVLAEVAQVAAHRLGVAAQRLGVAAGLPRQADDAPIGLELRERGLEHLARPLPAR